jgi:hypothetical protein
MSIDCHDLTLKRWINPGMNRIQLKSSRGFPNPPQHLGYDSEIDPEGRKRIDRIRRQIDVVLFRSAKKQKKARTR